MLKTIYLNGNPFLLAVSNTYLVTSQTGRSIQGKLASIDAESLMFECPIPGGKVQLQSVAIEQIAEIKKV